MNRYLTLLLVCVMALNASAQKKSPLGKKEYHALLQSAQQAILVTTPGWDSVDGTLSRFEKVNGKWQVVGSSWPIVVGKNGLGWDATGRNPSEAGPVKKEGDGRSPAGVFPITELFGFSPTMEGAKLPYRQLTDSIECVDDVKSAQYNKIVDRKQIATPDWNSSEKMKAIEVYQFGAVVGYNPQSKAGAGSCIFLHIWKGSGHGTAGCTAMDEVQLKEVLSWLDADKNPVLVQFPQAVYNQLKSSWKLP